MKQVKFIILMILAVIVVGNSSFQVGAQEDIAPRKNTMSCDTPSLTGLSDGKVACYGIWDDGDAFGDDSYMCPEDGYSDGKTGCQIKTSACLSGIATATKFYNPSSMSVTSSEITTFSKNLNWEAEGVKSYIFGLWVYTCGKGTTPPVAETGTYKGYLNGSSSPFITTEKITKASALENCKLNSKNNPKSFIYCTWNGSEIYSFTPVIVQPANKMDCSNPSSTGLKDGATACYGVWDYGDAFGNDRDMCENYVDENYSEGQLGCQVQTKACTSGVATATKYYKPAQMQSTDSALNTLANNMGTTISALQKGMAGMWVYTCGEQTSPTEETGTYKGYLNGSSSPFITTEKITKASALENCKLNSKNNPTSSIYCTWNGSEIYSYKPTPVQVTGVLDVLVNGRSVMTGVDMTRETALSQCKTKALSYAGSEIKCTWNNEQIYYTPATDKTAIFIAYQDGVKMGGQLMTKKAAEQECTLMQILFTKSELRCMWDGVEFFTTIDDTPEYCSNGFEYFSDVDRCVKSSYLTYYSMMSREYGYTISKLSVSKLKTVIERIEDIEDRYSTSSTTRLKLEALKLVIEKEIRKQEGDDFDFEDLFD